jgi:hypothetical protein
MQTTVDPATVKTRLDDNDRRLIARARQLAGHPAPARSLRDICADVQRANCGHCWAAPGDECVYTTAPVSVPVTPSTPVSPVGQRPYRGVPGAGHQHRRAGAVLGIVGQRAVPRLVQGRAAGGG